MTANGSPPAPAPPLELPGSVRELDSAGARTLAGLCATFDDLQTVLRCCERLVAELEGRRDDLVIESAWTLAVLSYGRCFRAGGDGGGLSLVDVTAARPEEEVPVWHAALLQLRDRFADQAENPRERFAVGVAEDEAGAPGGVAVTSTRYPLVDDATVRQTGAIAFALRALLDERIAARQAELFDEVKGMSAADLAALAVLEVSAPDGSA